MLRKIVTALIVVPLAVIIIAFALANRQIVTVSLDPFGSSPPALATPPMPLFALVIVLLIAGVIVGGAAAWLRQRKWRRMARRLEAEVADLRRERDSLKRASGDTTAITTPAEPPERLQLQPPHVS